jgi:hypothetical protein
MRDSFWRVASAIWRAGYIIEERRQLYAARGHLLRQAGACILLAVLRLAEAWR